MYVCHVCIMYVVYCTAVHVSFLWLEWGMCLVFLFHLFNGVYPYLGARVLFVFHLSFIHFLVSLLI